jgi:hypothetical protein
MIRVSIATRLPDRELRRISPRHPNSASASENNPTTNAALHSVFCHPTGGRKCQMPVAGSYSPSKDQVEPRMAGHRRAS